MTRIAGLSGSLRADSLNTGVLRAAARMLPPGAELEIVQGLAEIPPYTEALDAAGTPPQVVALREAIGSADALLVATPEFNGSLPGQLKNALDWLSRPFPKNAVRGLPTAVVGATPGSFGAVWAQADARRVLGLMGAKVLDRELPIPRANDVVSPDGGIADAAIEAGLRAHLDALIALVEAKLAA